MGQHRGMLTPEERARIMELQDLLIDRFVEHREATAAGREERSVVRTLCRAETQLAGSIAYPAPGDQSSEGRSPGYPATGDP